MPALARLSHARPASATLYAPPSRRRLAEQRDSLLFLGFPASPSKVPWSEVDAAERSRLIDAVIAGKSRLPGSWALVALEGSDEPELVVVSDYFGTRPLFWRRTADSTLVADDIWSLVDTDHPLDLYGIADMLLVGHPMGRNTLFHGVSATEADTLLRFTGNGIQTKQFEPAPPLAVGPSLREASLALERVFERLYSPYADLDRLLIPLSGGLDSRTLLALALERGLDVCAATYSQVPGSDEERIARRVASVLGVRLIVANAPADSEQLPAAKEMVLETSGQFSLEHFHGYAARHVLPREYPIAVYGTGGDNVCGGSMFLSPSVPASELLATRTRGLTLGGHEPDDLAAMLPGASDWPARLHQQLRDWYAQVDCDPRQQDWMFLRNRTARMNPWAPRAYEFHEYCFPFLDEEVARTAYGMPERWHRDWNAYRDVIRRRWPRLARIRWAKTGVSPKLFPGPRLRRLIHLRQRLERRPALFSDPSTYTRLLEPLISRAEADLAPRLAQLGIDAPALLLKFAPDTTPGQMLRLRLATVDSAIRLAQGEEL
jgi:asparagine synthetase B (glutamine-hydrolysing)